MVTRFLTVLSTLTAVFVSPLLAPQNTRAAAEEKPEKPNIILLMADDMGYECLSCNGGGPYKTPVLDKLAATGIRFTNAHSQPLCTPTRVEIMTGLYNFRNYEVFGKLKKNQRTFGHFLKDAGYATCIVGKWQLGRNRKLVGHFGFDEYCLWWLENHSRRYSNPGELIQNGKKLTNLKGQYGPDIVSNFMLDFITRHKDEPFFCYYPMILTHSPFVPTPDSDKTNSRNAKRNFVNMVQYTDKIVGRIVKHLEKLGLRENTVFIFTGDNGTHPRITSTLNGKPWKGGKRGIGENATWVPMVVNWPAGGVRGKVIDAPIDFTDFVPTLAELAGANLPDDIPFDGRSFAPQLRGEKGNPRKWAYFWYLDDKARKPPRQWVHGKRFKLYDDGRFYDMQTAPYQKHPLKPPFKDEQTRQAHKMLTDALKRMQQTSRSARK